MLSDAAACPSKAHLPPEIFQLSVLLEFNWPLTGYEESLPSERCAKSFHCGTIKVTPLKSRLSSGKSLLFACVCEKDLIKQATASEHAAQTKPERGFVVTERRVFKTERKHRKRQHVGTEA